MIFRLVLLGGIGYGVWKTIVRGRSSSPEAWTSGTPGLPPTAAPREPIPPAPTPSPSSRPSPSRPPRPPAKTGPATKPPTGRAEDPPGERTWVTANDGVCPQSHPVKAKLSSKIFHVPGSRNYSRTRADRCYPDEDAATADGLRRAMR